MTSLCVTNCINTVAHLFGIGDIPLNLDQLHPKLTPRNLVDMANSMRYCICYH